MNGTPTPSPADAPAAWTTVMVASCNVLNLALPGRRFYPNQDPYGNAEHERKLDWLGAMLRRLNADVTGFQEVWDEAALKAAVARSGLQMRHVVAPGAETGAEGTPRVGLATRLAVEALRSVTDFSPGESVVVPELGEHARFERPVLHATLRVKSGQRLHVLVAHLKSKRPKFLQDAAGEPLEDRDDPHVVTRATLRSLMMRAAESAALLEPWLGPIDDLNALPLPRLIAIELDRAGTPNVDAVREGVEKQFQGVTLDDHRRWQRQITTITHSFSLGGLAILALVAMATTAIIVSATKSSMASNREIVEVLHFVGATDRFIAREFEKHFLRLGVRAGLVGAILALAVFTLMPTIVQILGGGSLTLSELHRLVGSGSLDMAGYVLMGIVVVVIAALCMLTSRFGVFRILNSKH